ncbi:glycosyltransferase [Acidobacteria bacterium ACD]|nr:MAG: glycosyltransferase [Acidobacteriota bacterium]MDL1948680.1 glycosyltransferase [Acidobacteria bacterium ACD]
MAEPQTGGPAPKVSVLVRTKDRPALLAEALESLRGQELQDFEVVLVNDSDAPVEPSVLSCPPGRGLRVVEPGPPHGRSRALNAGASVASGRFLAYLDDDDLHLPGHLAALAAALEGPREIRAAFSDCAVVRQTLGPDGRYVDVERQPLPAGEPVPGRLPFTNSIPLVCLMHERVLWEECGRFDEAFDLFEDWEFLVRLSQRTPLVRVAGVTALYRIRDDGSNATTATPWGGAEAQRARSAVYRKHWRLHTPEAEMALVDGFHSELEALSVRERDQRLALERSEIQLHEARRAAGELSRRLDEVVAALHERAAQLATARAEAAALAAQRDALAAEVRDHASKSADLVAERDRLERVVHQMTNSLAWRLFTPWWKLKAALDRRKGRR